MTTKRKAKRPAPRRRRRTRKPKPLDRATLKLLKERLGLVQLCGATDTSWSARNQFHIPCDRRKDHDGAHIFEYVKELSGLKDRVADLQTPSVREHILLKGMRSRCVSIGPKPQYYRCGLDANHDGTHDKVIPADAPWFPGPCTCPSSDGFEGVQEPTCVQHGLQRKADGE